MQSQQKQGRFLELLKMTGYFGHTVGKLEWEEQCVMPAGAVLSNAPAMAYLAGLLNQAWADDELQDLIACLQETPDNFLPDFNALVDWASFAATRARALSPKHVEQWSLATSRAQEIWVQAKPTSNFFLLQPELEKVIELARERAQLFGFLEGGELYDGLLGGFEPGMTTTELRRILLPLRQPLVSLIQVLDKLPQVPADFLTGAFHPKRQFEFCRGIVKALGFDLSRGNLTAVPRHPMTITCGPDDIRLTMRVRRDYFPSALFAAVHEGGHGMFDQGRAPELNWINMEPTSMGIHESQSRLWENMIGRGLPFWRYFLPTARAMFYPAFDNVNPEQMWRAVNQVKPGFIRTEADEVTYNLHILLRFELELALLSGDLQVADLPVAWNEKMREYFGITPPDDAHGCMQDVHWPVGYIGYFPTYSLGNLLSAQLWAKMRQDVDVETAINAGNFALVLEWLREKIHPWGQIMSLGQLTQEVTGKPLSADDWLSYITSKFSTVYPS